MARLDQLAGSFIRLKSPKLYFGIEGFDLN